MVVPDKSKRTILRKHNVKFIDILRQTRWMAAGLLAGAVLAGGCSTAVDNNRRVYDRYAELVAEGSPQPKPTVAQRPAPRGDAVAAPSLAERSRVQGAAAPTVSQPTPPRPSRPQPAPAPTPAPASAPAPVPVAAPAPVQIVPPPQPAPPPPRAAAIPAPVVAPAAASVAPSPREEISGSGDAMAYVLKVGDMVQVYLRGIPNAEAIESVIDEHGKISLPFINEIMAAGYTASDLAKSIRRIYQDRGIYRNISVNVVVPTRYYFIQGEIRAPGRYQIMSATRLSQAIAAAGAYTEFASGQVVIKRNGQIYKTIKNAQRLERNPEDDILLEPDDIIEVRRSFW
jgi:protein involved in polysaccharide export with SLBB domain